MDGLSTDATVEIASSFDDRRIKIISEKDNGIYDAMNKGIKMAIGSWLYFLGSDDELYNNRVFEEVAKEIQNSSPDILYGDAFYTNSRRVYGGEFSLLVLLKVRNICHQTVFYSKGVFRNLGSYNLKYKVLADYDMNIRCFSHPDLKIVYRNILIAKYDERNGISSKIPDLAFNDTHPRFYLREWKKLLVKYNSIDYKVGRTLLRPLRMIKKGFGK